MTDILAIGDRTCSSWSLRGWLLWAGFGLPVTVRTARLCTGEIAVLLSGFGGATKVPAALIDGAPVWDSLAIAETLAERHPGAGHWPADPTLRQLARSLTAEMHSGFTALRQACPMNLAHGWDGFRPSEAVLADIARLDRLWGLARAASGSEGWLFGPYSVADAFFAPVAARFATYSLPASPEAAAYVARHIADPRFRQWRAMGRAEAWHQPSYDMPLDRTPWTGPAPLPAHAVATGTPVNATCPFSGNPVRPDSLAAIAGKVVGFCNPFCRDRSVADPEAWPEVTSLLRS